MKTEQVSVRCGRAELYSELYVPDKVPAPAILICHGMDVQGFHYLGIYRQLARRACDSGCVAMVFDFRGVGKSTGEFDYGDGEKQDVRCALDFLASRPETMGNILFVVGHSLGGAVSLYALEGEERVKGLALWSTPKNHRYNVRKFIINRRGRCGWYSFRLFSLIDRVFDVSKFFKLEVYGITLRLDLVRRKLMKLDECKAVSKLRGMGILVIIGEKDSIVGVDEAQEVYNSANQPKELLVIKDADHNYRGKEKELIDQTVKWITRTQK